jgi:hypothetical protein
VKKGRSIAIVHDQQGQEPSGFLADPPTPRRSRATLRTLDDVAVELARLYRRAERGDIPTPDASRLAYILTSLGKVLEASEIAARITALETYANENH